MTDINRIEGPSGSPENIKKDRPAGDAEKFKKEMHRVKEVDDTDASEQRKKKKRGEGAEEEEEELEAAGGAPTTPAANVPVFSLDPKNKEASPFDMQSPDGKISPMASAQKPTDLPTPTKFSFFAAPSPEELEDDSGFWSEDSETSNLPPPRATESESPPPVSQEAPEEPPVQPSFPQESAEPPQASSPLPPQTTSSNQPATTVQQPPQNSSTQQAQTQETQPPQTEKKAQGDHLLAKKPESVKPLSAPARALPKKQEKEVEEPTPEHTAPEGTPLPPVEETLKPKEDTEGLFEQLSKESKGIEKDKPIKPTDEESAAQSIEGVPSSAIQPPAASSDTDSDKKRDSKEPSPNDIDASSLQQTPATPFVEPPATTQTVPPPYTSMPAQVIDMFERMVGAITVLMETGKTETVITLNAPQFASSVFFGSQIIIQEFSAAPQQFNIQLNGTPEAVSLFQGNADDLMAAFQGGNYKFKINRLETGYLADRPLFKRKESVSDDEQKQTGG